MDYYKDFIRYKVWHFNLFKKVKSWEDFRYTVGLIWFGLTKIVFKREIDNETVRGR